MNRTRVELNSPYGYMKPFGLEAIIGNGAEGFVNGKINPTRGNEVAFDDHSHLGKIKVPSHWLKILEEEDGNDS